MKSSGMVFKIFVGMLTVFLFKAVALAQYNNYRGYGGWGMGPGMMGWGNMGWFGPIFMVCWRSFLSRFERLPEPIIEVGENDPAHRAGASA